MNTFRLLFAFIFSAILANSVLAAPLCEEIPREVNGCTLDVNNVSDWLEDMLSSDFEGECNKHDRCYQTLGKTRYQCDKEFKEDGYDECSINVACRGIVKLAYDELRDSSEAQEQYDKAQLKSKKRSTAHINEVMAGQCVDDPSNQVIYDHTLTDYVKLAYNNRKGRDPSSFEQYTMLKKFSSTASITDWKGIVSTAVENDNTTPPLIKITKFSDRHLANYRLDASNSTGSGLIYNWNINNQASTSPTYSYSGTPYPMRGYTLHFKGYLLVENGQGEKDARTVDDYFSVIGLCDGATCTQIP
ncbi:hypothetical protein [Microbulbifer sp. ALW1]|uniref:hypothetical protein n=1 Tax=Microbulbifer sp. (strain ALW1) TaxID=1516059 RepID=UPI001357F382|nr:hypothetical protein [Microbulbifer sp. ALW1]